MTEISVFGSQTNTAGTHITTISANSGGFTITREWRHDQFSWFSTTADHTFFERFKVNLQDYSSFSSTIPFTDSFNWFFVYSSLTLDVFCVTFLSYFWFETGSGRCRNSKFFTPNCYKLLDFIKTPEWPRLSSLYLMYIDLMYLCAKFGWFLPARTESSPGWNSRVGDILFWSGDGDHYSVLFKGTLAWMENIISPKWKLLNNF